ncbi:Sphingomyelin synthase-like domain [Sesbania bispinosa]|nr:Sphingomyelin synthase-like domain [Sesbania bispinosa]
MGVVWEIDFENGVVKATPVKIAIHAVAGAAGEERRLGRRCHVLHSHRLPPPPVPAWHSRLQPALWTLLALAAVARVPSYRHWSAEFRSAVPFIASMLFMLAALLFEALSVRSVTAVLGLDWHRDTPPLPDTGQCLLKKAGGGCNDLLYSGHMLVAVLTAMAWTEAYGGFSSALVWLLVIHSAQREVRERHHYSVDCIVAIYVGILLWKMTGFIWSPQDTSRDRNLTKLEKIQSRLIQASKDSDIDEVRELLKEIELSSDESKNQITIKYARLFRSATIAFALTIVVLAFILTSDG